MSEAFAILNVPVASVGELEPDNYVGLIDQTAVACLTARIAAEGLLTPIWVRRNPMGTVPPWSVIAGRHRLLATQALGHSIIRAEERAGPDATGDELRRLQVSENLDRRVLRPIERACFIMERCNDAAATMLPTPSDKQQSRAIRARWNVSATVADTQKIDKAVATDSGVSERTICRYRLLYAALVEALPEHFARLNAHPFGESLSILGKLASQPIAARVQAADMILSRPDWLSMDEVMKAAGLGDSTGTRHGYNTSIELSWSKMTLRERRQHVTWLVQNVTDGMAEDMAAALRERGVLV